MEKKTFSVEGMGCVKCKAKVEKALNALDGVNNATANLEQKNVSLEFDPSKVSPSQIKSTVDELGYTLSL